MSTALLTLVVLGRLDVVAQRRGGSPPDSRSARALAPVDVAGYWVSVVTEDWRWRMVTPHKGDYTSVPLNAEGRRVAGLWDLAKDEANGAQCKAYGIGGITRQPGRLHITWQDENTLKLEFDAGTQTRLLSFDPSTLRRFDRLRVVSSKGEGRQAQGRPEQRRGATGSGSSRTQSRDDKARQPGGGKTWQGYSVAEWEGPVGGRSFAARTADGRDDVRLLPREELARRGTGTGFGDVPGGGGSGLRGGPPARTGAVDGGIVKVETTHFREGYLRKNGVPYSENATITEYFQWLPTHHTGDTWLVVTTTVDDPKYLQQSFYTSTNFKREPNGSKWSPTACKTETPNQSEK